jgi:hypothetical protein
MFFFLRTPAQVFDMLLSYGQERKSWDDMFVSHQVIDHIENHIDVLEVVLANLSKQTKYAPLL